MQLEWHDDVEVAADQGDQPELRADLPYGLVAALQDQAGGKVLARIYDVTTGQETASAEFDSQEQAKAWVEEHAERIAAAKRGAVVEQATPGQDREPEQGRVSEASKESFPASDAPTWTPTTRVE